MIFLFFPILLAALSIETVLLHVRSADVKVVLGYGTRLPEVPTRLILFCGFFVIVSVETEPAIIR